MRRASYRSKSLNNRINLIGCWGCFIRAVRGFILPFYTAMSARARLRGFLSKTFGQAIPHSYEVFNSENTFVVLRIGKREWYDASSNDHELVKEFLARKAMCTLQKLPSPELIGSFLGMSDASTKQ